MKSISALLLLLLLHNFYFSSFIFRLLDKLFLTFVLLCPQLVLIELGLIIIKAGVRNNIVLVVFMIDNKQCFQLYYSTRKILKRWTLPRVRDFRGDRRTGLTTR